LEIMSGALRMAVEECDWLAENPAPFKSQLTVSRKPLAVVGW